MQDIWDALERIAVAPNIPTVVDVVVDTFSSLVFDACYFVGPLTVDPRIGRIMTSVGLSSEFEAAYRRELFLHDPLPSIGLFRATSFRWETAPEIAHLTADQQAFLQTLAEASGSDGLAIPCFGPHARCGFVGAGKASSGASFEPRNVMKAEVVGRRSFQRYCEIVIMDEVPAPPLSNREQDVIVLIAQGKSNSVISEILGLSSSTVNSYVRRIFEKLSVNDRTTAAVRALALGLIGGGTLTRFEARYLESQDIA
jgi:LuxR family quorum-sensing system transcriptional regulator CciR